MRKKVSVNDVRPGMFIDELCGSWKASFKLKNGEDLKSLRNSGIREVWIDTTRGKDVESRVNAIEETEAVSKTDQALSSVACQSAELEPRIPFEQELDRARKIQTMVAGQVTTMFQEVRMGKALQASNAIPLTNEIYLSVIRNPGSRAGISTRGRHRNIPVVRLVGNSFGVSGMTSLAAKLFALPHRIAFFGESLETFHVILAAV